jgi:methionyl-tRNA formyltransferase
MVGFYCMNKKGFFTLSIFIRIYSPASVSYVVSERDYGVEKDFYDDIRGLCLTNSIPFYEKSKPTNVHEYYKVAIGWKKLIKDYNNLVVLHDSLLPKYRGFAPVINMLINGETRLGVTSLFASDKYDSGDIIYQDSIDITYPIKIDEAISKLLPVYANVLIETHKKLSKGNLVGTKQNHELASYSPWLDHEDYFIDWSWSIHKIKRFIDAVGYPYDGSKTYINNKVLTILDSEIYKDENIVENVDRHIGKVLFFVDKKPIVVCRDGLLKINSIKEKRYIPLKSRLRNKLR